MSNRALHLHFVSSCHINKSRFDNDEAQVFLQASRHAEPKYSSYKLHQLKPNYSYKLPDSINQCVCVPHHLLHSWRVRHTSILIDYAIISSKKPWPAR
eukprot:9232250-Karenia_brevis.AAC.1